MRSGRTTVRWVSSEARIRRVVPRVDNAFTLEVAAVASRLDAQLLQTREFRRGHDVAAHGLGGEPARGPVAVDESAGGPAEEEAIHRVHLRHADRVGKEVLDLADVADPEALRLFEEEAHFARLR